MATKATDRFANIITESVECSTANTLTFQEITVGLSIFDKAGILLNRIEYIPSKAMIQEMTAADDTIEMAVTTSNTITTLSVTQTQVIDKVLLNRLDLGTAASGHILEVPIVRDMSTLPGGGVLITPRPWYIALNTAGLASAGTLTIRFYFTVMKLQPAEYFELLETRTYFG